MNGDATRQTFEPSTSERSAGGDNVVLALVVLAIAGASLVLCVKLWALPEEARAAFVGANTLDAALRKRWLVHVFAGALTPLVFALPLLVWRRERAARWLGGLAARFAPLCVVFTLPSLLDYRQWYGKPLPYLIVLLCVVLILERLLEPALLAWSGRRQPSAADGRGASLVAYWLSPWLTSPPVRSITRALGMIRRAAPLVIVVIAAGAYAAYTSHYSILRHHRLGSAGFDLGIFDNLMVNLLEGRPFYSSVAVPNGSYLSNHAEYGMFLFAPLYALRPGAETLLVLQSVMIGGAAIPLFLFAATQISRGAAATLACAYLLYAPLHGANFFDFHWMPLSMFFFFWLFHAIVRHSRWEIAVLLLVICSLREDAPFGLIATGLFLIATGYWPRLGVVLTVVPALWFVVVKFIIMPWAGPWWFADIYKQLMAPGENGYGSVVRTILVNPSYFLKTLLTETKLVYALHLFVPLLFLPLRHSAFVLLMIPGFIVTLMTTGYAPTTSISFQYTTHWIPFLFAATAIALGLRERREREGRFALRASLTALCCGVLCHSYVYGAILQHETFTGGFTKVSFTISDHERRRYADLRAVAAKIPPRASVAATEQEVPHISTRPNAYTLKVTAADAEYLFINRHHLAGEARSKVEEALAQRPYQLVARQGEYFLFKQGPRTKETDQVLRRLKIKTVP